MKKFSIPIVLLLTLLFLTCNNENLESDEVLQSKDPNFRVIESTINHNFAARESYDDPCMTTNLIAGQDFENPIGTISVDRDGENGENIIITYDTSQSNWTIDLTHLSIGDCEQSIPTTGSGNPKVGRFEHTEPHSVDTNHVVYMIDLNALIAEHELEDEYCFAAHAEVTGPDSEETAWAEGPGFTGNNWAMFVQANLSDCDLDCELYDKHSDDFDCDTVSNEEDLDMDGDGLPDKKYDGEGILVQITPISPEDEENFPEGFIYDSDADNCPNWYNPEQSDLDGDGIGDSCDNNIDGDQYLNNDPEEDDMDGDGITNDVDDDLDGDGKMNVDDNCRDTPNEEQIDIDGDGVGDNCGEVR